MTEKVKMAVSGGKQRKQRGNNKQPQRQRNVTFNTGERAGGDVTAGERDR